MIYSDEFIFVELEISEVPWVKVFTKTQYKELSHCDEETRNKLFKACFIVEKTMLEFYSPDKINWASFANYLCRVHIHIQARFLDDSFFPESLWGIKQRDGLKRELNLDIFSNILANKLNLAF